MSIPPELGIIQEVLRLGMGVPDGSIPGGQAGRAPGKHMRKHGMSARINEASLQPEQRENTCSGEKQGERRSARRAKLPLDLILETLGGAWEVFEQRSGLAFSL